MNSEEAAGDTAPTRDALAEALRAASSADEVVSAYVADQARRTCGPHRPLEQEQDERQRPSEARERAEAPPERRRRRDTAADVQEVERRIRRRIATVNLREQVELRTLRESRFAETRQASIDLGPRARAAARVALTATIAGRHRRFLPVDQQPIVSFAPQAADPVVPDTLRIPGRFVRPSEYRAIQPQGMFTPTPGSLRPPEERNASANAPTVETRSSILRLGRPSRRARLDSRGTTL